MGKEKSNVEIIVRGVFVFIVFFLVLKGLTILSDSLDINIVNDILLYLNLNLFLILLMFVCAILAQFAFKIKFPFNLVAPILKAIPIVFAIKFSVLLLVIAGREISKDFSNLIDLSNMINPIIFVIILILGYYKIMSNYFKYEREKRKIKDEVRTEIEEEREIQKENKSHVRNVEKEKDKETNISKQLNQISKKSTRIIKRKISKENFEKLRFSSASRKITSQKHDIRSFHRIPFVKNSLISTYSKFSKGLKKINDKLDAKEDSKK